ncbi:MAG: L-rhamnose/proton symporter RhaT [Phycisphaerales bacterium]|nr:MAG: L-rhamnose/proton symporter RhaT [Phycisphaerales bacterium]
MTANPFLGVTLHAAGGLAAGSFYIPFKRVRYWAWESYWLVGGFSSWIIMPWLVSWLTVPDLLDVLGETPAKTLWLSYAFGVLWGIGGLTFGLSMRYLGMSLGYAVALGFCAAFGTVLVPIHDGVFLQMIQSPSGWTTLAGVAVCLGGIGICGTAGARKERELPAETKTAAIAEFSFVKGVWVAVFAGVMSACMAFGIAAGKPIAGLAEAHGTHALWRNSPVFIIIFAGGFTTNVIWCLVLNVRNGTARDYVNVAGAPILSNYLFSVLAGITWYLQFMFYGMGTTRMGKYDFSSWTIHMAFIIVFSNVWALLFREWRGASRWTVRLVFSGIVLLILSTVIVGIGTYLASAKP